MIKKILITDSISSLGIDLLKKQKNLQVDIKEGISSQELLKIVNNYHCLITRSQTAVDRKVIDAGTNLQVIARAAVGVANIDIDYATEKGLLVVNTPQANTNSAAEHTMAILLALNRKLCAANNNLKNGKWEREKFVGHELLNKTIGIVGLGNVGHRVAHMAHGFDMKVVGYDPFLSAEKFEEYQVEKKDFFELLKIADIISIHVPKNKQTIDLITKKEIKQMKDGVILVNAARGGIVNEEDLYQALKNGKIASAAIDTWETEPDTKNKLQKLENVIGTPHIGASTIEAQERVGETIARQVINALNGEVVDYPVNLPNVGGLTPVVRVYAELAEKLGSFAVQQIFQAPPQIKIFYRGKLAEEETNILKMAFLQGFLKHSTEQYLSYVNVEKVAVQKNLKIIEIKDEKFEAYPSALKVMIYLKDQILTVGGTVHANLYPRLTRINYYYFEVEPAGNLLIIRNYDKPGAIGHIGGVLAKNKVNIARFNLVPNSKREKAMAIVKVDKPISEKVKKDLLKFKHIISVKQVEL